MGESERRMKIILHLGRGSILKGSIVSICHRGIAKFNANPLLVDWEIRSIREIKQDPRYKQGLYCKWCVSQILDNKRLNRLAFKSAIVFNSLLLGRMFAFMFISGYAQEPTKAKVTFFEDRTFVIENGTIRITGDYIFTNPSSEEIDYTQEGLKLNQSKR